MQIVEFMLADGSRKVGINPATVVKILEAGSTRTNIFTVGYMSQADFVSVTGSFAEVKNSLNVSL